MLDRDLAELYGVSTGRLNEQVRRNRERFPSDFIFQLNPTDLESLRSQNAILETSGRGRYSKYPPYAFTEQGVAMLSGVLRSPRAVEVNVAIMRAFVKMREVLSQNQALAHKLEELENKLIAHDCQIEEIVEVIRQLMTPTERPVRKIGYKP